MADSKPVRDTDGRSPGGARQRVAAWMSVVWAGLRVAKSYMGTPRRIIGAVVSVVVIGGGIVGFVLYQSQETDGEKLQRALTLLDDRDNLDARHEARTIAVELQRSGFRDPNFAGGAEYVLGIVAFRKALDSEPDQRERYYLRSARKLRDCERQALAAKYRPEWSYTLGVSLHELGNSSEALPLLQEAERNFPTGKTDASMRLIDVLLDRKQSGELRTALKLADKLLKGGRLTGAQRDRVLLNKAQVHLALNEHGEAQAALKRVSNTSAGSQGLQVSRTRTHMATAEMLNVQRRVSALPAAVSSVLRSRAVRHYRAGLSNLASVASAKGLETTFPRQARYLSGICAQRIAELESRPGSLPNYDSAINYFVRTARDFPKTHEAVAAGLRAAELLRVTGRSEEALKSFRRALQSGGRGGGRHNRWISQTEFREILFRAWNEWREQGAFASAIELSGMMSRVVPEVRAQELHALANMEWARKLERDLPNSPSSQQKAFGKSLLLRRQATGKSYARLAELVKTTNRYSDSLWTSAVNFHAGHDFENALRQYTEFINTQPKKRLAQALVRRGRVLMDLDRLKEARDHFQQVRDTFGENPARFEALFLLGTCHLEMGEDDAAESIWRGILASPELTPAASEWRMSLFMLGRHQFHKAKILKEQAEHTRDGNPKQSLAQRDRAAELWRESIRRLEEHEERYPTTRETVSARFLIAKAAQELAGVSREKLDEAEVENVRNEYRRRMNEQLKQAGNRFRQLQTQLLREEEADRLHELGRSYLRDCYYEIAHTLYALERFDAAILAYTNAANRYPQDPQVLLAYLQMANCNDRKGDASEALSLILQAEVILKQLPDEVFNPKLTGLTKQEWQKWLTWAKQLRKSRPTPTTAPRLLQP